jgi:hypothetical protein
LELDVLLYTCNPSTGDVEVKTTMSLRPA